MKKAKLKKLMDIKKNNKSLLFTIHLKCAECFGFFSDGWQICEDSSCPLFPYFPTHKEYNSIIRTRTYLEKKDEALFQGQKTSHKALETPNYDKSD